MRAEASLIESITAFIRKRYGAQIEEGWFRDPFKVLVGCVLSQRTREENTDLACKSLFSVASTPEEISKLPLKRLERLIKVAGLAPQKAKNLKRLSKILLEKYGGKVPSVRESLLALPGVGAKTADVTLCYGLGEPCIPVDVHVNRISRRLGLVGDKTKLEEVGEILQKAFPVKDWHLINRGFVLFGREICLPRNPKCSFCTLSGVCKHGRQALKRRGENASVVG
jgi:endonuclease-3